MIPVLALTPTHPLLLMFLFLSSSESEAQPNDSLSLDSSVVWFNSKSHTRLLPFALGCQSFRDS